MRIEGSMDAFPVPLKSEVGGDRSVSSERAREVSQPIESVKKAEEVHRELSEEEVFQQVADANQQLKVYDRRLEFSIHDETHRIMVKVINTVDDSVIREIPSEKALDMLAYVWKMTGILVDEKR